MRQRATFGTKAGRVRSFHQNPYPTGLEKECRGKPGPDAKLWQVTVSGLAMHPGSAHGTSVREAGNMQVWTTIAAEALPTGTGW